MSYSEKLHDPRWQKKRLEILQRDGWKCLCCEDSKKTLNVHHLVYHKEPWDAPQETLETLCEDCHDWRESFNLFWGHRSLLPTRFCYAFIRFSANTHATRESPASDFQKFWELVKGQAAGSRK